MKKQTFEQINQQQSKAYRKRSGAMPTVLIERSDKTITVGNLDMNTQDVLAVPGSIYSPNAKGTNKLIRQGATPITGVDDLLEALGFEKEEEEEKQQKLFEDLSPEEKKVINLLREPMPRDELIRALGIPIQNANSLLTVMEIKNLIKEEVGEIRLY